MKAVWCLIVAALLMFVLSMAQAQQNYTITLTARQVKALKWEADRRNSSGPPSGVTWTAASVFTTAIADLCNGIEQQYVIEQNADVRTKFEALSDVEREKLKDAAIWTAFQVWLATQK